MGAEEEVDMGQEEEDSRYTTVCLAQITVPEYDSAHKRR